MERRIFLLMLVSVAGFSGPGSMRIAFAKDGGDRGEGDDGDDDDRGSDRSGHSDDGDRDDDRDQPERETGHSDREGGENKGSSSPSSRDSKERREVRKAVEKGQILPLREILKKVDTLNEGRVIGVDLNLQSRKPFYTFKMQKGDRVKTLKLDASTGRKMTLFGW